MQFVRMENAPLPPYQPPNYEKSIYVKGIKYIRRGKLGEGATAKVYRVEDPEKKFKAIKYVNLTAVELEPEMIQSCLKEVELLEMLQGPGVIKMFDHETTDHSIRVVLEIGDTNFNNYLRASELAGEKVDPATILHYWKEMLRAVKHIHDNRVVHSDLKPHNFLLVQARLKLIDFGISSILKAEKTSLVKDTAAGTLNYMSPEALTNIRYRSDSSHQKPIYKISRKSDVWSLGCILYKMVYDRTPFENIIDQDDKINGITDPREQICYSLPTRVDNAPTFLNIIIRECLQRDPVARPSVDQLLQLEYLSKDHNIFLTWKNPSTSSARNDSDAAKKTGDTKTTEDSEDPKDTQDSEEPQGTQDSGEPEDTQGSEETQENTLTVNSNPYQELERALAAELQPGQDPRDEDSYYGARKLELNPRTLALIILRYNNGGDLQATFNRLSEKSDKVDIPLWRTIVSNWYRGNYKEKRLQEEIKRIGMNFNRNLMEVRKVLPIQQEE